jgi:hypothetical protein
MDTHTTLSWMHAPDDKAALDVLIEAAVLRTCPDCNGTGLVEHYPDESCPDYLVECGCQDGTVEDDVLLEYELLPEQEVG